MKYRSARLASQTALLRPILHAERQRVPSRRWPCYRTRSLSRLSLPRKVCGAMYKAVGNHADTRRTLLSGQLNKRFRP